MALVRRMEHPMQHPAKILEDEDGQFVLLPASVHFQDTDYWCKFDQTTGNITLNPKLSTGGEIGETQRQRDIQAMTEIIAAKAKTSL